MTKILFIGITGYIGGTTAELLIPKHPEYEITALVRNEKQADQIETVYPNVRTILGDLDSSDLIKEESAKSDIVFHCANSDHIKSIQAILDGLGSQSKKTFFIHTTGVFHFFSQGMEMDAPTEKIWSDVDDIQALLDLPVVQPHGPEDKLVMSRGGHGNVNVAMVDPPSVYGKGLGPIKTRATLVPLLTKGSLLNKKAIKVGKGAPSWSAVHVTLLADVFIWLFEQAAAGGGTADWNEKGWYFVENDTYNWSDLAESLGKIGQAKGYFDSADVDSLTIEEAKSVFEKGGDPTYAWFVPFTLGAGARISSDRLKALGFEVDKPSVVSTLEEALDVEAKLLGIEAK
ncbi:hypothetical protein ABW19_dt0208550 [Dactylella cylindrospora]|nr:hypothetical protein ABW19_dt0208550 [Dactylella cylindrospora]